MRRGTAATHGDADTAKLLAHSGPGNAQLGTDLAHGLALGVQVGRTPNIHCDTVMGVRDQGELSGLFPGSLRLAADSEADTVSMIDDGPFARLCIYRAVNDLSWTYHGGLVRQTVVGKFGTPIGNIELPRSFQRSGCSFES